MTYAAIVSVHGGMKRGHFDTYPKNLNLLTVGSCPLQAEIGVKHESISQLHSRIQNLTDLTVQAQYNSTHGLPVIVEQATEGTTIAEQVGGQHHL